MFRKWRCILLVLTSSLAFACLPGCAGKNSTEIVLTSSANPVSAHQTLTLIASVSTITGGGKPSGIVVFKDNNILLAGGQIPLSDDGTAIFLINALEPGTHDLTAEYTGSDGFKASFSQRVSQIITRASSTISLTASTLNPVLGQEVVLTATVMPVMIGSGPFSSPTGTVVFFDDAVELGRSDLGISFHSAASALFYLTTLSPGEHLFTATFIGNASYLSSSNDDGVMITVR